MILIIQIVGIATLWMAYNSIELPDESALAFGKDRVFQGEEAARFVLAVAATRRVVQTAFVALYAAFAISAVTLVIAAVGSLYVRDSK